VTPSSCVVPRSLGARARAVLVPTMPSKPLQSTPFNRFYTLHATVLLHDGARLPVLIVGSSSAHFRALLRMQFTGQHIAFSPLRSTTLFIAPVRLLLRSSSPVFPFSSSFSPPLLFSSTTHPVQFTSLSQHQFFKYKASYAFNSSHYFASLRSASRSVHSAIETRRLAARLIQFAAQARALPPDVRLRSWRLSLAVHLYPFYGSCLFLSLLLLRPSGP
ncbi:hypothetical protein AAVH_19767, partial [Aphelenchoides avenae]